MCIGCQVFYPVFRNMLPKKSIKERAKECLRISTLVDYGAVVDSRNVIDSDVLRSPFVIFC